MDNLERLCELGENDFEEVPKEAGVYMIRCVDSEGKPIKIPRAGGIDEEGILYIGKTINLRERTKSFWDVALKGTRKKHSGASTYYYFDFNRVFPKDQLEVRWIITHQPERIEKLLLNSYMKKYLDTPPLNLNIRRYFRKTKILPTSTK